MSADSTEARMDYDPHRFDVERTRRRSSVFPKIVFAFVLAMVVIGGSAYFIKTKISGFMQTRKESTRAEQELEVEDKPAQTRRFEDLARDTTPPPAESPIPVLPAASSAASAPAKEPETMMLAGPAASDVPADPPRMRTIEAFGEQAADRIKTPTTTPQVSARQFGDRSYLLARGSFIPCVLETQLVSNIAGSSNCVVPEHVYSENGRVLLIEKGSKIVGEYRADVKQGDVRIAIIWQRIKTPGGVVIDVDSPTTDEVGAMGVQGGIDNHWPQRIGAAVLLSLVSDAIELEKSRDADSGSATVVNAQNTTATTKSLAERILDSTINIPPTIMKNRGDRVTVYLNRDLWFNTVYTHAQAGPR